MLPPSWTDTWGENRSHELVGICSSILLAYAAGLAAMMGQALTTEMGQEFLVPRSTRRVWYLGLTALLSVMAVVALILGWCGAPRPAWSIPSGSQPTTPRPSPYQRSCCPRRWHLGTSALVLGTFPNSGDEYAYIFQAQTYLVRPFVELSAPLGPSISQHLYLCRRWQMGKPVSPRLAGPPRRRGHRGLPALGRECGHRYRIVGPDRENRPGGRAAPWPRPSRCRFTPCPRLRSSTQPPITLMSSSRFWVSSVPTSPSNCRMREGIRHAVALGVTIGLIGMTRYVSALWLGLALAIALCARPFSSQPRALARIALGVLPFVLTILVYHWALTGDPLKPVYWAGGRDADRLYIDLPSLAHGLFLTEWRLLELAEWTSPLLLVGYGTALAWKLACRSLRGSTTLCSSCLLLDLCSIR